MIQQSSWSSHKNSNSSDKSLSFGSSVSTSHDKTVSELSVSLQQFTDDSVSLHTQFSSGRDDHNTSAIVLFPVQF